MACCRWRWRWFWLLIVNNIAIKAKVTTAPANRLPFGGVVFSSLGIVKVVLSVGAATLEKRTSKNLYAFIVFSLVYVWSTRTIAGISRNRTRGRFGGTVGDRHRRRKTTR